ncbi:MAG: hypothetical protein WCS43_03535 [Verrucomicrobiota bacterium]
MRPALAAIFRNDFHNLGPEYQWGAEGGEVGVYGSDMGFEMQARCSGTAKNQLERRNAVNPKNMDEMAARERKERKKRDL